MRRLAALWREGLVRNSAFLMGNMALGAGFGFVFITALARLLTPAEVGLVTTAMSTMVLVSALSALGLNYSLVRFLPEARDRSALVNTGLTLVGAATVGLTVVLLAIPQATGSLFALGGAAFVAAFVVGNLVAALKGYLENLFVAERAAGTVLSANLAFNVGRILLLGALLPLGALGAYWAHVAALLVGLALMVRRYARSVGHRFRPAVDREAVRSVARFSAGSHVSSVVGGLPAMALPLIVLERFGAEQAAYWNTAMMVATLIFALPGSIGRSLFAEGSHRPGERRQLMVRGATIMAVVMVPVVVVLLAAAPLMLSLFGASYEEGSLTPLRLLVLSSLLVCVNYVAGTLLYLGKHVWTITAINVVDLLIVLGLALGPVDSVTGMAVAWTVGELVNVVLFCLAAWWLRDAGAARAPRTALAS